MKDVTDEQVREWRQHPVTEALEQVMRGQLQMRMNACEAAYWQGNPKPEAERVGMLMMREWIEDFFASSADDIRAFGKMTDEE